MPNNFSPIIRKIEEMRDPTKISGSWEHTHYSLITYQEAVEQKQWTQELDGLLRLFSSQQSSNHIKRKFLRRCKHHSQIDRYLSPLNAWNSSLNQLYFAIYQLFYGPQPFSLWAPYFLPDVHQALMIHLPTPHAVNPRVVIQDTLEGMNQNRVTDLSIIPHLVIEDGLVLDLRTIAQFTLKQFQHLLRGLEKHAPLFAFQLFRHNCAWQGLKEDLKEQTTLREKLSMLIVELRRAGTQNTGQRDAHHRASIAISLFIEWLSKLPRVDKTRILALCTDKQVTIYYILYVHLIKKHRCVETAATELHHILNRPQHADVMDQPWQYSSQHLRDKYLLTHVGIGLPTTRENESILKKEFYVDDQLLPRLKIRSINEFVSLFSASKVMDFKKILYLVTFNLHAEEIFTALEQLSAAKKQAFTLALLDGLDQPKTDDSIIYKFLLSPMLPLDYFAQLLKVLKPEELIAICRAQIKMKHVPIHPWLYHLAYMREKSKLRYLLEQIPDSDVSKLIEHVNTPEGMTQWIFRLFCSILFQSLIMTSVIVLEILLLYLVHENEESLYSTIVRLSSCFVAFQLFMKQGSDFLEQDFRRIPTFRALTTEMGIVLPCTMESDALQNTQVEDSLSDNSFTSLLNSMIRSLELPKHSPRFLDSAPYKKEKMALIHELKTLQKCPHVSKDEIINTLKHHLPKDDSTRQTKDWCRLIQQQLAQLDPPKQQQAATEWVLTMQR